MKTSTSATWSIPVGVPHLPANLSGEAVTAVIGSNEQESLALLPELDALLPARLDRPASGPQWLDRTR